MHHSAFTRKDVLFGRWWFLQRIRNYEVSRFECDISIISPPCKAQGWLQKKGQKDDKNQRQWMTSAKHIYWTGQCVTFTNSWWLSMSACLHKTHIGQCQLKSQHEWNFTLTEATGNWLFLEEGELYFARDAASGRLPRWHTPMNTQVVLTVLSGF